MRSPLRAWADLPIRAKGFVVVLIPLAALLVAVGALYAQNDRSEREQQALRRLQRVSDQIRTVRQLLEQAQTGVRGHVLTGQRRYLQPFEDAFARLPGALAALEKLVGDDPVQLERARRVRFLAGRELETLARLRTAGPLDDVTGLLARDERRMRGLRRQLGDMGRHARSHLEAQIERVEESAADLQRMFAAAIAVGLLGGLVANVLFTRGIFRRIRVLERNARLLAEGAPLPDRPPGSDELGRLAEALGETARQLSDKEERLRLAKDAAERASWAKSDFLSRASHELRTPLSAIIGFASVLRRHSSLDPLQADALERIERAGEHLQRLLRDFLDIGRIEAGVLDISLEPVDVEAAIAECVDLMRASGEERGVTIVTRGSCGGARARADGHRLRQVLLNIISNAIKYNREQGHVSVSCRRVAERIAVTVTDEGPGIPADKLDRLFVPFDRLDRDGSTAGTGLGLAVSKSLVELMGGALTVSSKPGMGATFEVTLGVWEETPGRTSERKQEAGLR